MQQKSGECATSSTFLCYPAIWLCMGEKRMRTTECGQIDLCLIVVFTWSYADCYRDAIARDMCTNIPFVLCLLVRFELEWLWARHGLPLARQAQQSVVQPVLQWHLSPSHKDGYSFNTASLNESRSWCLV